MSSDAKTEIALFILAVAFNAGLYVMAFRQVKRDVNGLGKKFGRLLGLLTRWADTEEKRSQVADLMEGK